jgi:hypothetical protein
VERIDRVKRFELLKVIAAALAGYLTLLLITGFSYLDPGTGSLLVQIVIAAVIAAAATLRRFRKSIIGFLRGSKKGK